MRSEEVKQAEIPIAAQLAQIILGSGLLLHDQDNAEQSRAEAAAMNEELRILEARKMDQTINALKFAGALLKPVIKTAAQASLQKTSGVAGILGGLARAGASMKQGIGGAAQAAGRLLPAGSPAQKSWMGLGTKAKLLGGAAVVGTGVAGYKGLQMARNYMQRQPHVGWGSDPALKHNVNEYGQPE